MQSVDVLLGSNQVKHFLLVNVAWEWQLHKYTTYLGTLAHRPDALIDLLLCRLLFEVIALVLNAKLVASLLLEADVHF